MPRLTRPSDALSVYLLSSAPLIPEEAALHFSGSAFEYRREEEERRLLCDIFQESRLYAPLACTHAYMQTHRTHTQTYIHIGRTQTHRHAQTTTDTPSPCASQLDHVPF